MERTTLSDALTDPGQRKLLDLPAGDEAPLDVVVELNLFHEGGLSGATERFKLLYEDEVGSEQPRPVGNTYFACRMSMNQIREPSCRTKTARPRARERSTGSGPTSR